MAATDFCAACGADGTVYEHHVQPRALGGEDGPTVSLCAACHGEVHEKNLLHMNSLALVKIAERRANGKRIGQYVPFGFALADDGETLLRDGTVELFVWLVFAWYANGDGSPTIAKRLNEVGSRRSAGKKWQRKAILYILQNDLYLQQGIIEADLFERVQARRRKMARKHGSKQTVANEDRLAADRSAEDHDTCAEVPSQPALLTAE